MFVGSTSLFMDSNWHRVRGTAGFGISFSPLALLPPRVILLSSYLCEDLIWHIFSCMLMTLCLLPLVLLLFNGFGSLQKEFVITDLGDLHQFLGMVAC